MVFFRRGKRDRACSPLLYHALRRDELCRLKVRILSRSGVVCHMKISGKGEHDIYHCTCRRNLIHDYLDAAGHGLEDTGHYSVQPVIIEIRNHKNNYARRFISWYRNTLKTGVQDRRIRYAQQPQCTRSSSKLESAKWLDMPILLPQEFTSQTGRG